MPYKLYSSDGVMSLRKNPYPFRPLAPKYCPQDTANFFNINVTQEGTWNPSQLNTKLWLDATDNSTITLVSNLVSQWNDKSGNGHHCTQSSSSLRPSVNSSSPLNFKQAVSFTVTTQNLTCTNWNLINDNIYCFLVFYPTTSELYRSVLTQSDATTDSAGNGYMFGRTVGTGQISSYLNASSRNTQSFSVNNGYLFQTRFIGGLLSNNLNFGSFLDYSGTIDKTMTRYGVNGGLGTGGITQQIGEIIVFNSALSTTDIEKIEGYLAWKWSFVSALPSLHPYKNSPPNI